MTAALEVHAIDKVAADYYSQQSAMSDPGHHRALFAELQNDVRSPARIIHGLGIYDVVRSMEKRLDRSWRLRIARSAPRAHLTSASPAAATRTL